MRSGTYRRYGCKRGEFSKVLDLPRIMSYYRLLDNDAKLTMMPKLLPNLQTMDMYLIGVTARFVVR